MLDRVKPPEPADRADAEETAEAAGRDAAPPRASWFRRLAPQRLTTRIVLLNLLGLIILVAGILYFNQFRQGLIDARVQSLTTQAQIIAAAVAGSATVDTGSIVIDPDSLADSNEEALTYDDQLQSLDFPIDPETAGPVLKRLLATTTVRARIIDKDGNLIVDSRFLYSRGDIVQSELPPLDADERGFSPLALWNRLVTWTFSYDYPKQIEYSLDNGRDFPEVNAALNGAKVSLVRLNDRGQIIVLVAVPVQRFRAVLGALVLSTTGGEIDDVLRAERQVVLMTFGFVALVTVLLSTLLASTIALPLRKLAAAAERVRRGINKRVEIPDFSGRGDEIGDLSGAVRDMTNALYNRIAAIEAFAADVSHELKNPLTSLRSAVETLAYAKTPEQRERLVEIVKHDVRRLDRLITDISDASRLDAELARGEAQAFDLSQLLEIDRELCQRHPQGGAGRSHIRDRHAAARNGPRQGLPRDGPRLAAGPGGAQPDRQCALLHQARHASSACACAAWGLRSSSASMIAAPASAPTISSASSNASTPTGRREASAPTPASGFRSRSRSSTRTAAAYGPRTAMARRVRTARSPCSAPASSCASRQRSMHEEALIHGTCLAIGEAGVLLVGQPGSGKSDLALRLIDGAGAGLSGIIRAARLVADDQVAVRRAGDRADGLRPAAACGQARNPRTGHRGCGAPGRSGAAACRAADARCRDRAPSRPRAGAHGDPRHRHSAGADRPRKRLRTGPHPRRAGPFRPGLNHVASHSGKRHCAPP